MRPDNCFSARPPRRLGALYGVRRRASGAVAVMFAGLAVFIFALAAFAIDIPRVLVVRNELQNAADAAALAGAGWLMPLVGGSPNWSKGQSEATKAIGLNRTEGSALQTGTVDVGYWDIKQAKPSGGGWTTSIAPTADDLPAVRVTISRDTGQNSGPVGLLFARLLGINLLPASATGTAVISSAAIAGPGALMPFAISNCILNDATGLMTGWPTNATPAIDPGTGAPYRFLIASAAAAVPCGPCSCGQWTSFDSGSPAAAYVNNLIVNGTPVAMGIGTPTYIQPGTEASLYDTVQQYLVGRTIAVPIVDEGAITTPGFTPVVGYACLVIDAGIQGGDVNRVCSEFPSGVPLFDGGLKTNKCVIGHFADPQLCELPSSEGGGGGPLITYVPARLVQ